MTNQTTTTQASANLAMAHDCQGKVQNSLRFQSFPMDEGNDQWGVRDTSLNKCWSDDGWQQPDSGRASVLTHEESLQKVNQLEQELLGNVANCIEHAATGQTGTFAAKYDQYAERNGQSFTVLGAVDPKSYDADEGGVMFHIRFADGTDIQAWPEEVESAVNGNVPNCASVDQLKALGYEVRPALKNPGQFRWWKKTDSDGVSVPPLDCSTQTFDSAEEAWADVARIEGKVQKPPRALEPKASAELAAQVLSKMDAYSRKPMIRHEGAGYVVGAVPKNRQPNQPIAVVDGDFGRAEFKAVHAEIEQMGLEFGAFIVVAKTATYSGHRILFSKFEDLGIERVVQPKDDSPSPGM